jgi:hypothetical protein
MKYIFLILFVLCCRADNLTKYDAKIEYKKVIGGYQFIDKNKTNVMDTTKGEKYIKSLVELGWTNNITAVKTNKPLQKIVVIKSISKPVVSDGKTITGIVSVGDSFDYLKRTAEYYYWNINSSGRGSVLYSVECGRASVEYHYDIFINNKTDMIDRIEKAYPHTIEYIIQHPERGSEAKRSVYFE